MSKDKNGLPTFSGSFKQLIPEYICYRRAQGYQIGDPIIYHLREMDLLFEEMGIRKICMTREMYEAYTKVRSGEKDGTTSKRCSAIKGFATYLVIQGYRDIYTGYDDTRIFKRDFIPYVFSKDEIASMFKVLEDRCLMDPSYDNEMFQLIMLMYYCCGFRKSELQKLLVRDVDFQSGKITVLHGKNDVCRIVIASESLLNKMRTYQKKYLSKASSQAYLFHGKTSDSYSDYLLYRKFHQLLYDAGIKLRSDGDRQRLHDLRHTFCVRALEQMQEKGFDLYTSLPLLSVYLGHKHITETEYYLRILEEHFGDILNRASLYSPSLFPKCEKDEKETGYEG